MPKIDLLRLLRFGWAVCLLNHPELYASNHNPDANPPAAINFFGLPPALQTVECGQSLPAAQVSATSTCPGGVTIMYREWTSHLPGECVNSYTLNREWKAGDHCGNTAVYTARVNFIDHTPPVFINPPPDLTGDCVEIALAQAPDVSDACGTAFIKQFTENLVCAPGQVTFVRTWVASDKCLNTSVYTQHAIVIDTVPPRPMDIPADTVLLPGEDIPAVPVPGPWGCDLCGQGPEAPVCFKEQTFPDRILRIWQFCDCAGNCVMDTQVIHLANNLPPVFVNLPSGPLNNAGLTCFEFQFVRNQVLAFDPPNYDQLPIVISDSVTYNGCGDRLLDYVHYSATDAAGATISTVIPISVSEESCFPISYCQNGSQSADNEWIQQVKIGAFTQNSNQSTYTDFTAIPVQLAAGSSTALMLTAGYNIPPVPENWTAWLDLNRDGQFDENAERVDLGSATGALAVNLHIPANALPGAIRLRIAMSPVTIGNACDGVNAGEVEDYQLKVKGLDCLPNDCAPVFNSQTYLWEYISKVKIDGYANLSNAARYSDFRNAASIPVARGQSYALQATATSKIATTMDRIWHVYADFNRDGDFTDANESVGTVTGLGAIANFALNVPADAVPGRTTLRFELSRNALSNACSLFGYGEIEDYALFIQPDAADSTFSRPAADDRMLASAAISSPDTWSLSPNPASSSVHLDYSSGKDQEIRLQLLNAAGVEVFQEKMSVLNGNNHFQINFGALPAGVYHVIAAGQSGRQEKLLVISE